MRQNMKTTAGLFPQLPDLMDLALAEARIILALRFAIAARDQAIDPVRPLAERLGNGAAVKRFRIMVETIGHAWPEAFQVGRCCCPRATPDEILLVNMVRSAARQNRPLFDSLLCEMIGDSERDRIYTDLRNFISSYLAAK